MKIPLGHSTKIKVNQYLKDADGSAFSARDAVLLLLPAEGKARHWSAIPHGSQLKKRLQARGTAGEPALITTELPDANGTRVVLADTPGEAPAFARLTRARKLAAELLAYHPATLLIQLHGLEETCALAMAEALLSALLAATAPLPSHKTRPEPPRKLTRIDLYGLPSKLDLARIRAEAQGNHLARWLTRLPPNQLTPHRYRRLVEPLARQEGWSATFRNEASLARRGCGAFLAVSQGSPTRDAGILQLRYRPAAKSARPKLALVGKGICFDTGGVNIKSARYMHGMHEDMAGSAVALGTLLALTRLQVDFPVDCWLALAENHVGPSAYKPNDVVRACDGTSIEIIHTDAEGRMVLADTLALAGRSRPDCILDFATLTGACIQALSTRYSGALCNRPALTQAIIDAGRTSGERVWPFPMDGDFDEMLDSDIADIKQCSLDNEADQILAARFLQRFVPTDCTWVHLDLASANHKGGLAHIPTDATGFGIRFATRLLLDADHHWSLPPLS